ITLSGIENPEFAVSSDSPPLIINAPNVTLDGLSITNTAYRPTELVRIISTSAKITNCNLTGRGKPTLNLLMDGITTVEEGAGNYVIEKNRITAFGTGIRLLPYSEGAILDNNISDSINGICIDRSIATITGNSWSGSPNDTDILITANTQAGPPYDNTEVLSLQNNKAVVKDQRII
ncbi:MAG: Protein containing gellan lyase domain, partial [Eubacterium sp.]|nr:Protein containing gellan lyase domain [Eubacterium sp.]